MSNLTRKKPVMRRAVDALSGLLMGTLAAGGVVLLAAGPIMNLPGKVDSNNALVVASVSPGTIGSQGRPIANLPGKVDANNALVVTLASGSTVDAPVFTGQSSFADGTAAAPSIAAASDPTRGFRFLGSASAAFGDNDTSIIFGGSVGGGVQLRSDANFRWSSTADASATADLALWRDAANTLALRNGANAQEQRWYGTFTDAANYSMGFVRLVGASVLRFGTEHAGTGTARSIIFHNNGLDRWEITTAGHLLASTDNTYDIGASGATRPRTIYAGTSVLAAGATGGIGYATGAGGAVTQITSKATGVTLNTVTGNITMEAGSLAANTAVSFTLTDSAIAATDLVVVTHHSGGTAGAYTVVGQAAAGSAVITLRNVTGGALAEAVVLKFAVIKGAVS